MNRIATVISLSALVSLGAIPAVATHHAPAPASVTSAAQPTGTAAEDSHNSEAELELDEEDRLGLYAGKPLACKTWRMTNKEAYRKYCL